MQVNEWGHGFIVEDKLKLIIFFETFAFYNWKIMKKIKKENWKEHKTCISDFAKSLTAIVNSSKYLLIPYHSIVDKAHYSGCQVLFYLWWIKPLLKPCNFPKYFDHHCLTKYLCSFKLTGINQIYSKLPTLSKLELNKWIN